MNDKIIENRKKILDEKILSNIKEPVKLEKIREELALSYLKECFRGYNFTDKCPLGITEYIPPKRILLRWKMEYELSEPEKEILFLAFKAADRRIRHAQERAGLIKPSIRNKILDLFGPSIRD